MRRCPVSSWTCSRGASGYSSPWFFRIRTCISSPWQARRDGERRQKVSQKHSQKMGPGSDFYPSQVCRRGTDRVAGPCRSRCADGGNRLAGGELRGVRRRRRLLDGRRVVPPGKCREMGQPWRERQPSRARSLTLSAPPWVVHATAAPCHRLEKRHVIAPPIEGANAVASRRLRALNTFRFARVRRSPIAARKESVCR